MKRKAILHIGAGYMQIPSINYAKELGFYVVVTDRDVNALGIPFADRYEKIDGSDVESLLRLAKEIQKENDLVKVFATSDFGLKVVALINQELNITGVLPASVDLTFNKQKILDICRKNNLNVPSGMVVNKFEEIKDKHFDFPVIIKPIDSCGSQGVRSAYCKEDLKDCYNNAKEHSELILIEELLIGNHIDVNGLFWKKKFYPCGTLDRVFSEPPYHYPIYGIYPSFLNKEQEKQVYDLLEKTSILAGIDNGPVKGDIVWTKKGPFLIEMGARFHGDVITQKVIPEVSNFNPIKNWFSMLDDGYENNSHKNDNRKEYAGWIAIFPSKSGVISSVSGLDEAKQTKGVYDVFFSKKVGEHISKTEDNTSVCGFVWAKSTERENLKNILFNARDKIKIGIKD